MDDVLMCVLSGGVAVAGIKLVETLIVWRLNRKAKKEDDAANKKNQEELKTEERLKELEQTVSHLKNSSKLIMYDRIKYLCRSYLRAGEIDFDDLEDLIEMHSCYHNELGGNGKLNDLMELVKALPLKE